jgi:hypothetical protein
MRPLPVLWQFIGFPASTATRMVFDGRERATVALFVASSLMDGVPPVHR